MILSSLEVDSFPLQNTKSLKGKLEIVCHAFPASFKLFTHTLKIHLLHRSPRKHIHLTSLPQGAVLEEQHLANHQHSTNDYDV